MAAARSAGCVRARERWSLCRAADRAPFTELTTLDEIVRHYVRFERPRSKAEIDYYAALPSMTEAKRRAGRAERPDGKRHDHQTRITAIALQHMTDELRRLRVERCRSFDELHGVLEATIGMIRGVGPLTVYDTAVRVGAYLGLTPRRVYLHAGVRKGASALGLGRGRDSLRADELPAAFRRLVPREIEDCLCIYKDQLTGLTRPRR